MLDLVSGNPDASENELIPHEALARAPISRYDPPA